MNLPLQLVIDIDTSFSLRINSLAFVALYLTVINKTCLFHWQYSVVLTLLMHRVKSG